MKTVTALYAIFFAIIAILSSCSKKSNSPAPAAPLNVHFSSEGMEYIDLPAGMFLIYKDSATGKEDSVIVTASDVTTGFSPEYTSTGTLSFHHPAYYYDIFLLEMRIPVSNKQWFFGKASAYSESPYVVSTDSATIPMNDKDNLLVFGFPVWIPSDHFDQMTVEGNTYHDVLRSYSWNGFEETDTRYIAQTIYWAKQVGIIKWQKKNGNSYRSYTLVRHG